MTSIEGQPAIADQLNAIDRDRENLLERVAETNSHLKSYNVQFQRVFTTVGFKNYTFVSGLTSKCFKNLSEKGHISSQVQIVTGIT